MKSGKTYVVGLSNANAQYWGTAGAKGAWSISKIIPGTYTLTVYKDELEVATSSVTITAGKGTAVNTITCVDPQDDATIWRIGEWDGKLRVSSSRTSDTNHGFQALPGASSTSRTPR